MSNYPNQPFPPPYSPAGFSVAPPPPRGPRKYSIPGAMARVPFFNGNVFRDVARNWNGIGFWYLFLLLLITWIFTLVKIHLAFAAFVHNDFPKGVKDVPPITIRSGHVTSPVDQPYFIKDSKGKTLAVLDTTGAINSMDDTDAQLLVTDHKVWSRQGSNNSEIKQYDLSKIQYFYIDKAKLIGWANLLSRFLAIVLFPIVLVGSLIGRLIQALIYGAINLGFSSGFNANLSYAAAMRLAVVSVTPVILLNTIFSLARISFTGWTVLGICISLFYMAMAVRANATATLPPASGAFPISWPPTPNAPPPYLPPNQ